MNLVEKHIIRKGHPYWGECNSLTFKSKNLYNYALYEIRQRFFNDKKYFNYCNLCAFIKNKEPYTSLPAKVSQQTLRLLDKNFKSFFNALKVRRATTSVHISIPQYKDKVKGRFPVIFTNQAISKRNLQLSGTSIIPKTLLSYSQINQIRIIPRNDYFVLEIIYEKEIESPSLNTSHMCGIDIGLDNLATIGFNGTFHKPFIINGRPLKSINQYFNKKKSTLNVTTHRFKRLSLKRSNKISDYFHKASRYIINQLVSSEVGTLVIGHNKGWKQEINIGKRNNQNFVSIPFNNFIHMLKYKAELQGIKVIIREEAYTSKCSFLDKERISKHITYKGKRIKRGLFRASSGKQINADLNGALNILRKEVSKAFKTNEIEALVVAPVRISF